MVKYLEVKMSRCLQLSNGAAKIYIMYTIYVICMKLEEGKKKANMANLE